MDIKQLTTFQEAAESLNLTQTAKKLKYSQSNVTAQIKGLEQELGVPLFERLGKRIHLTDSGHTFKRYADQMIATNREAKLALHEDESSGTIIVGAQESQCTYRLMPILKSFKKAYPKVKVIFKPAHSDERARQQIVNGALDIAFIMDRSKPAAQLNIETLIEETLVLVASPDHPLTEKPHILPNDLRDVTVLLTEKGCSYREVLEQFIQPQGIEPNNQIEFVSIEAIKQCVMADLGIAILPKMAVTRELYNGEMKALTWTPPIAPMYTHLAWHKDKRLTEPLQAFLELTRAVFI